MVVEMVLEFTAAHRVATGDLQVECATVRTIFTVCAVHAWAIGVSDSTARAVTARRLGIYTGAGAGALLLVLCARYLSGSRKMSANDFEVLSADKDQLGP